MKKSFLLLMLITGTFAIANAQDQTKNKKDSWPAWTISKDVQRMRFKNVEYTPTVIRTGNADWTVAKGVHRRSAEPATGNVSTSGYPTWSISKGVARQQAERNARKN